VIPTEGSRAQQIDLAAGTAMTAGAGRSRSLSTLLGVVTLLSVGLLMLWDALPRRFPPRAHEVLSAFSLALIALACLVHRLELRPTATALARTSVLAAAFFFWSANQLWPEFSRALLLNDLAVALFVLDVVLEILTRPGRAPVEAPKL
jgi:hypothetical protein